MNAHDPLAKPADGGVAPGYRLDNFELQAVVLVHANGVVYRAWDHNLGIPVAIKEYLPQHLAWRKADGDVEPLDADAVDAFERGRHAFANEARVLARCDHPSLLRVRQLLHAHGTSYRVMPWYAGRPLLDVRHDIDAPPDEPALRALLGDLLDALEAYHRVGGVHGGVNPTQILLLDDDRALLLGPGTARRDTAIGAVGSPVRPLEPSFAAPEQLAPSEYAPTGPWTDFFALAGVVRFCISGMLPPPPGGPVPEPVAAMVEKLYFDAPGVRYSQNFLATLDAAASLDIAERPQSVAAFRDGLDHGPQRAAESPLPAASPAAAQAPLADGLETQSMPTAAPAPGATVAEAPATTPPPTEETVDAETVALIQRVIESIPPRSEPLPLQAPLQAPPQPARVEAPWQAQRLLDLPPTALPRRRRPMYGLWLLLVVLLLGFIGYAAWELRLLPARSAEPTVASAMPSTSPAPVKAAEEAATAPMAAASAAQAAAEGETPPPAASSSPRAEIAAAPPTDSPAATSSVTTVVVPPVAAASQAAEAAAHPAAPASPDSPRELCGDRTEFSLYRCMQQQCAKATWARHPQCLRMKATDRVD